MGRRNRSWGGGRNGISTRDVAVGGGMLAAAVTAGWSAYNSRDEYWAWLFPASLALGIAVSLTLRIPAMRRLAHDFIAWCRFIIAGVLALVGLFSSVPVFAVRLLLGLVGPVMVLYLSQSVVRRDAEMEAKDREIEALKMATTTLEGLNSLSKVQRAQVIAETAAFRTLLERGNVSARQRRRVAGHRRRRR